MSLPQYDFAAQLRADIKRAAETRREAADQARAARLSLQRRQHLAQAAGDRLKTLQERTAARVAATAAKTGHGRENRPDPPAAERP